jgi:excinuclease ABC subunit C
MNLESLKKLKLPDEPGVYFFRDKNKVLYIGKATSLKDRVKSYFGKDLIDTRGPLIADMVFKSNKLAWQETDSVLEALILEADLIKKHQPYYNTKEKDDKSFNIVCITKEAFPKVLVLRERNLKVSFQEESNVKFQAKYGPFTNGPQLKEAMNIIRRIFSYLDAKSSQPNSFEFYRQIGLAPEIGTDEARISYNKNIKNLKLFFQGKKKKVISNFKKEMFAFAKNKEFERANEMKQKIFALQHINDVALLKNETMNYKNYSRFTRQNPTGSDTDNNFFNSSFRIESYDIAHMGGKNMVGVMTVVLVEDGLPAQTGEVAKSEYKKFKIRTQNNANDTGALTEILERRLAHKEWIYPDLIVVDGGVAQLHAGMSVLKKFGVKIPTVSVVKDEHHKPKDILFSPRSDLKGAQGPTLIKKYKREILLSNSEAHRFAIAYHKKMRNRNFLR